MIRNNLCTKIETNITNNINLMSRYVSAQNTIIENILSNICREYFENDENAFSEFVNQYLEGQGYEKYDYQQKMFEIIKFVVSTNIYDELFNSKIFSKLTLSDINYLYKVEISISDDYYGHEDYQLRYMVNKPEIVETINKLLKDSYQYSLNFEGKLITNDNKLVLHNIMSSDSNEFNDVNNYLNELQHLTHNLINIINKHINLIFEKV